MPQYTPEPAPNNIDPVLSEWLMRELMRISNSFVGADDEALGYQPLDQDLTDISGLLTTSYGRAFLTYTNEAAFKTAVNLEANIDFDPALHAAPLVTTIADADEIGKTDSGAGFVWKRITWANIKVALNAVYARLAVVNTFLAQQIFQGSVTGANAMNVATASLGEFQVQSSGGGAAMAAFHRVGTFAAYFGIDTDNVWKVGGWSMGANAYKIWHAGNDGAGSGLDADLLDGLNAAATNTASTVATRDASGDIVTRLFRTEWGGAGWNKTYLVGMNANGGAAADNYMRPTPIAVAMSAIFQAGFESTQQTITAGGALTIAHGLGIKPVLITISLVCTTAEAGYAVGNEIPFNMHYQAGVDVAAGISVVPDATNLNIRFGSNGNLATIIRKDTGAKFYVTNANWKAIFRCWG